jgi:putative colanic acid biosynthesis acetyltransferase WcaF
VADVEVIFRGSAQVIRSAKRVAMTAGFSYVKSEHPLRNKLARFAWQMVYALLYRPSPRPLHGWRCMLLRMFGAKIARGAHPYPSAKIWAPWNLEIGSDSSLGDYVDCYCVNRIKIGNNVTVSQYVFLCAATHDYQDPSLPLVTAPITVENGAWLCAGAFIAPGVTVGEAAVVGARAVVTRNVGAWDIVAGNPAKFIKKRVLRSEAT